MSTAALPGSYEIETTPARKQFPALSALPRPVRRRGSLAQGRALETLGHAVEYLVDSRMFDGAGTPRDEDEALQILMRMSRAVFAECPEVVSLRQRCGAWMRQRMAQIYVP